MLWGRTGPRHRSVARPGLLAACGRGEVSVTTSPLAEAVAAVSATVTATATFALAEQAYDLDCGAVPRVECERRTNEFVADFVDDPPPDRFRSARRHDLLNWLTFRGTIDATLSDGTHITGDYH